MRSSNLSFSKSAKNNSFSITAILWILLTIMLSFFILNINNFIIGMAFITIGLIIAYYFKRKYRDWLNPATIHSAVWICIFGLSYLGDIIARYETGSAYTYPNPSERTILVVFASYILFILGVLITTKKKRVLFYRNASFFERFRKSFNLKFLKIITIILFIISFSFYIFFLYKNGWIIPILAGMPRGSIELPVLGYFSMLLRVTAVLGVIYCLILYKYKGHISKIIATIALFSMLTLFTNVQRVEVMTSLIMIFMAIYYIMDKKVKKSHVLALLLSFLATFYSILYFRAKSYDFERLYILSTYRDTGASFRHLSFILETEESNYRPLFTIQFLDAFFKHRLTKEAVEKQLNIFEGKGNIATYLAWIYLDFGIAGLLFIPVALGFITGLSYMHMIRRPNIFTFFVYAILAVGIFAMSRQLKFTATTEIVFYPVIGYLVYLVTKARYKYRKMK